METNIPNVLAKKYKELIKYISQIGNGAEYRWDSDRIIIKIQNNAKEDILFIKLHQSPYAANPEQEYLEIYWREAYVCNYGMPHKFHQDTDQRVIFHILLFEIINRRLQNLDFSINEAVHKVAERALSSEAIINFLRTKEEQIRVEEKAKIESRLSVDEFRKIINKELGKISINLKIGDK